MAFPLKKYYANTPCTFVGTGDIVYIPDDVEVTELEPTTGAIMMALNDKGSLLPPGYTRIAYLENSFGACGIQVPCPEFYRSEFDVQVTGSNDQAGVAGILIGFGGAQLMYCIIRAGTNATTGDTRWYAWGGTAVDTDTKGRHTVIHMMDNTFVSGAIYYRILIPVKKIDEETGEETVSYKETYRDMSYNGNTDYIPATFYQYFYNRQTRIWGATLSSVTGEDKKQLVPAIAPDGTMGLFDVLQGGFHTNVGSNKFVAGIETPDQLAQLSNNLPVATPVYNSSGVQTGPTITLSLSSVFANSEYLSIAMDRIISKNWIVAIHEWVGGLMSDEMSFVPASFLESDGQQYIITATTFDSSSELTYESQCCDNSFGVPVGCMTTGSIGRLQATEYNESSRAYFYFGYGKLAKYINNRAYLEIRDRHKIAIKNAQMYLNGELIGQLDDDGSSFDDTPLSLFCRVDNKNGVLDDVLLYKGRIFSCALKKAGFLAAQFIPSLDNTGTPCMYDTITKQSFFNSGSGDFILGVETEYNLDAIIANLATATPEYDTDGTTQIGPVIKISVPSTWNVDISDGSTSFAKKMYDAAFEKKYILQFSQH